jgi:ectoine hydroxylase-related dioxygenase (phytanoyl-CoA dioxygenase family)
MPVTDVERYLFDLQGFLVVPDAVDAEALATINAILDERLADADPEAPAVQFGTGGGEVLGWGRPFLDLVDNPRITPYLEEFVDPYFRLDHEYIHVLRPGAGALTGRLSSATLHGGGTPFDASQYYRFCDGRVWSGLTVVAYYLRDVNPGDGGLACVPGSHKANFALPENLRRLDGELPSWIVPVPGPAGTAVIFTEAQSHGTLPWRGAGERRTLFYKYSPHAVSWSWRYYDPAAFEDLTDRQRAILEPPNGRSPKRQPVTVVER